MVFLQCSMLILSVIEYLCRVKKSNPAQLNIQTLMLIRLLIILLLFFLSRIVFYLFNTAYFSGLGFSGLLMIFFIGLRFDISAIFIINAPYVFFNSFPFPFRTNKLYQGFLNGYFYFINGFGLLWNFMDMIYFRFTLKRTTADFFSYMEVGGDFSVLIPHFLKDYWYIPTIWLIFVFLMIWLTRRFRLKKAAAGKGKKGSFTWYFIQTVLFLVIIFISVIGIRGGFQLRPITLLTAGKYTAAKNIPLLLNTPFSMAKTFRHESLKQCTYYKTESELSKIYTPLHKGTAGTFKGYNVMIIIMESYSREHIASLNRGLENGHYQGFTPFLDSLIGESLIYEAFANGKTSIQGIPAVLSGIPSLMNESFLQSNYASDKYTSLAGLLKEKGYTTAFFHGGTNGTMGFDNYTKLVGFDQYYGRTEYNDDKDYDGEWGIRDEAFFQYTARTMNGLKPPFIVGFFSLSSHHPFTVPAQYEHKFRDGHMPIQKTIMYADYSLGRFFETAKKMPWFDNTLFIITADHTSEGYYPYYQSSAGQFAVPIIFYKHNSGLKGMGGVTAQQTDIMPTVLSLLGYDKEYLAFGTDLLDTAAQHFSIHNVSGLYGLIKDGYLLQFDGTNSIGLYDLVKDSLQKNNLAGKSISVKKNLEIFVKGFIQQYNNRIIENRLLVN
jgi:phosphoglycerol transferase MdoB-like AlkP superfamily enzyme